MLRKPRKPKLDKIDLTNVQYPDSDTDTLTSDLDSSSNEANFKTNSSNSTERDYTQSSFYFVNNQVKKTHKVELPRLRMLTNDESQGDKTPKTPKTGPNSVLDVIENDIKKKSETEKDFYMKTFEKHRYKSRMSPIRSAEQYHKNRKETLESSHSLVKPFKPVGPSSLPKRPLKYHHDDHSINKRFSYDAHYSYDNSNLSTEKENEVFKLNDFLLSASNEHFIIETDQKKYLSSANYSRINKILIDKNFFSNDSKRVSVHTIIPEVDAVETRKPTRQSLIEMAAYLKEELKKKTGANLKTKFQPVSKWQRMNGPQTELVIYEEPKEEIKEEDKEITRSQIAILDAMLKNTQALSLKSYFIDKLPDLKELKYSIRYINLSFNNFKEIPDELFTIRQLVTLKMRSNPLKYLSDELSNLQNLKVLTFSYCQFNEIPHCILELGNLQHLDLAYNRIKKISDKIDNLRTLKTLSLEGNEIEFIPCCMLKMTNLKQINVKNNYLHPLIWRKLLVNNPQSLFNLCAIRFQELFDEETEQYYCLTDELKMKLKNPEGKCDCCGGNRYDDGLKIIRPHIKIFEVKYLPFLFNSCSPKCLNTFKSSPLEV